MEMFEIHLRSTPDGTVLLVQAQPGARRNGLNGVHDGRLKVAVTQAPEKGKANKAVAQVLAEAFQISKGQVELIAGPTSSRKEFRLIGLDERQVRERLAELL